MASGQAPQSTGSALDPIYAQVIQRGTDLDEARFVDAVSRSLARGEFDLIVAGDGIRSDIAPIASYLQAQTGMIARLALVEFQIWKHSTGEATVIPVLPLITEVIEHRVVTDASGGPLVVRPPDESGDELESRTDPERANERRLNRAFWDGFIRELVLDHPDQAPPRHGGNNYVALPFPNPAERLVAYRTNTGRVGVFFALRGEGAEALFETLRAEAGALSREVGRELRFEAEGGRPRWHIGASENVSAAPPNGESRQYEWLKQTVNSFVRVFRRRLA